MYNVRVGSGNRLDFSNSRILVVAPPEAYGGRYPSGIERYIRSVDRIAE
jgi:hypothetical protein